MDPRLTLRGDTTHVYTAQFSPDGKRIVTASEDQSAKTASIWDVATGQELILLRTQNSYVNSARFSPDGSRIVTSSWYNTVQVWDAATGKELGILSGDADDHFVDAQFSADGKTIVTESFTEGGGYHAYLWDASTGHRRASLPGYAVRLSRDGEAIVTGTGDTVCVWQTATGNLLTILQAHDDGAASTGFYVSRAEFSPDGTKVVAGSDDKTAHVWDVNTGNQILVLRGHAESVGSAHFSQDGKRIVTASQDYTARLWDAATGKELDTLRHDSWVDSAQFLPDGKTIVTIVVISSTRRVSMGCRHRRTTGHFACTTVCHRCTVFSRWQDGCRRRCSRDCASLSHRD